MKNYAILDYYVLQSIILARLRDHCLDAALSGRYSCEISHDEAIHISGVYDSPSSLLMMPKKERMEVFRICLDEYRAGGFTVEQTADGWTISWGS